MSTAWSPPRTADELPDDDHECAYMLTGGLYDGAEIGRRERKMWPERRCPPFMRKDPEFTAKFHAAVLAHDEELFQIMKDVEDGVIDLTKITEEDIITGLRKLSLDKRRPAVQLGALTRLAEMKGMLKNKERVDVSDDKLEELLNDLDKRRGRNGHESTH